MFKVYYRLFDKYFNKDIPFYRFDSFFKNNLRVFGNNFKVIHVCVLEVNYD